MLDASCSRLIENEYLGLKNGIMDQSICVAAAAGQLTVVDCSSRGITHHAAPWGAAGESVRDGVRCQTVA